MKNRTFVSPLQLFVAVGCLVFSGCIAGADSELSSVGSISPINTGVTACGAGTGAPKCATGSVCVGTPGGQSFCRGMSSEGQRCGSGTKPLCQNGLVCNAPAGGEGICRARVGLGKACGGANPPCTLGLFCDMTSSVNTCQPG